MYDFEYHKPGSIADAVKILSADPDARPISGGQTLLPALKHRLNKPTSVVDLSGIAELKGIRREGDKLVVGALARHNEVANSPEVKAAIPTLAHLAGTIGDTQVRNRGTIGGSSPTTTRRRTTPRRCWRSAPPSSPTSGSIAADDFFQGMFTTALEPGELRDRGRIPDPREGRLRQDAQPGQPLRHGGCLRGQDRRRASGWRSTAPAPACSARRRWRRR